MKPLLLSIFLVCLISCLLPARAGLLNKHDEKDIPISHPSTAEYAYHRLASWMGAHEHPDDAEELDSIASRFMPESAHDYSSSFGGYGRAIYEGLAQPLKALFTDHSDLSRMDTAVGAFQDSWSRMRSCLDQESKSLQHNARLSVDKSSNDYRMHFYLPGVKEKDIKLLVDPDTRLLTIEVSAETEANCGCEPESAFMRAVRSGLRPGMSAYISGKARDLKDGIKEYGWPMHSEDLSLFQKINDSIRHAVGLETDHDPSMAERMKDYAAGSVDKIKSSLFRRGESASASAGDVVNRITSQPRAGYEAIKRKVMDSLTPHVTFTQRVKSALGMNPSMTDRAKDSSMELYGKARERYNRFVSKLQDYSKPSMTDRIKSSVGMDSHSTSDRAREAFDEFLNGISDIYGSTFEPSMWQKFKHSVGLSTPSMGERAVEGAKSAVDSVKDKIEHSADDLSDYGAALLEWLQDHASNNVINNNYELIKRKVKDTLTPHVTFSDRVKRSLGMKPSMADRAKDSSMELYDKARGQYNQLISKLHDLSKPSMTDRIKSSIGMGSHSASDRAREAFDEFLSGVSSIYASTFEPTLWQKFKHSVGLSTPSMGERAVEGAKSAVDSIKGTADHTVENFSDYGAALLEWLQDHASSNAINNNYEDVKRKVKESLTPHVTLGDRVKSALGMSPSITDRAKDSTSELYDKARVRYDELMSKLHDYSKPSMTDRIKSSVGMDSSTDRAREAFDEFLSGVSSIYASTFEPTLWQKFKHSVGLSTPSMGERAVEGAKSAVDSVKDKIEHSVENYSDYGAALLEWLRDMDSSKATDNYEDIKRKVKETLAPHASFGDRIKSAIGMQPSVTDRAKDSTSELYGKARTRYDELISKLQDYSKPSMTDRIKSSVGMGSHSASDRAREAFDEFLNGISDIYGSTFEPSMWQKFRRSVGLSTPSMGERAVEGAKSAVDSIQDKLSSSDSIDDVSKYGRALLEWLQEQGSSEGSSGSSVDQIVTLANQYYDKVKSHFESDDDDSKLLAQRAKEAFDSFTNRLRSPSWTDKIKSSVGLSHVDATAQAKEAWTELQRQLGRLYGSGSTRASEGSHEMSDRIHSAVDQLKQHVPGMKASSSESMSPSVRAILGTAKSQVDRLASELERASHPSLIDKAKYALGVSSNTDKLRLALGVAREKYEQIKSRLGSSDWTDLNLDDLQAILAQGASHVADKVQSGSKAGKDVVDDVSNKAEHATEKGASMAHEMVDERGEQAQQAVHTGAKLAETGIDTLRDKLSDLEKQIQSLLSSAQSAIPTVAQTVQETIEKGKDVAHEGTEKARETIPDAVRKTADVSKEGLNKVHEAAGRGHDMAKEVHEEKAPHGRGHDHMGMMDRIKDLFHIPGAAAVEIKSKAKAAGEVDEAWTEEELHELESEPDLHHHDRAGPARASEAKPLSSIFASAEHVASSSSSSVSTATWLAKCKGSHEGHYKRTEHITRHFKLPVGVDLDHIHSSYSPKHHTLQIVLPRQPHSGRMKSLLFNLVDEVKDFPSRLLGKEHKKDKHHDEL